MSTSINPYLYYSKYDDYHIGENEKHIIMTILLQKKPLVWYII